MKLVVFSATLLLLLTTGAKARCRCNFTLLKHQLNDMHTTELPDFERIASVMDGLTDLGNVLYNSRGEFVGHCGRISNCNDAVLQDLISVNLQLQISASRSVLHRLPEQSGAVKTIESTFFHFDNYIKQLANLQAGSSNFMYEFSEASDKLQMAMKTLCKVVDDGEPGQAMVNTTLVRAILENKSDRHQYLPICIKLHSSALQYLLMLHVYYDQSNDGQIESKYLTSSLASYNKLRRQLLNTIQQLQQKQSLEVETIESQLKLDFRLTGIVGVTVVVLIITLAAVLLLCLLAKRRETTTSSRVIANPGGYDYETGYV